jgi:trimeric autotransporter adhesin
MNFFEIYRPSFDSLRGFRASVARLHVSAAARRRVSYVLILALFVTTLVQMPQTAQAVIVQSPSTETIIGLTTGNQLVTFNSNAPDWILSSVPITGLAFGEVVIGIDFRPANNQLYGFTNYNRLVTLNPATGAATLVASVSQSLSGNEYGIDFNPVADRLRIVNDNDQNASVNPADGVATLQTPLNPGNPNVTGIAYTNNFAGATTTTLYDIDSNTDTLYIQNPPASGTLSPVGPLGVDTSSFVGFDISGASGVAYASLSSAFNASSLYAINLATGQAQFLGQIGSGPTALRDITISPIQPQTIFGVTTANRLITFNSARPDILLSDQPITGLANGEVVLGIDFRPLTNQLFGFTSYNRIITLSTTGVATVVGSPNPLGGNEYGFDFNPVPDRIRIVNDNDQNVRINPDTGATAATDSNLAYAPGDPNFGQNPNIGGEAYTNSVAGATATTLYGIDFNLDILVTQGGPNSNPSPNTGQLFTVGPLGVNTSSLVGFDISGQTGIAYASLSDAVNTSRLYAINLATGAASLVGQIGRNPQLLRSIAISTLPPQLIFGVTSGNNLVLFNSLSPGRLLSSKPITGLANGENVLGIDFRPATGQLYGYTSFNRLIRIDTATAAATILGTPANLVGNSYGFDFNPVPDRIRVVNDNEQNIRVNPNDGTLTATDSPLAYQAMDPLFGTDPNIVGAAYTNSFAGATTTTLYYLDSRFNSLATSPNPNSGIMQTVAFFDFGFGDLAGFDIAPSTNAAYAALQPEGGGPSSLFAVDLTGGLPNRPNRGVLIGDIGGTETIIGIAIAPSGMFQFNSPGATVTEGTDFTVTATVVRTGDSSGTATVNYTTQNGTASAGLNNDYVATSGTLTFNPGETSKDIVVQIVNNADPEPTETFSIVLSSPTGGFTIGSPSTFVVTILDND